MKRILPVLALVAITLGACKPGAEADKAAQAAPGDAPAVPTVDKPKEDAPASSKEGMPGAPDLALPKRESATVDTTIGQVKLSNQGSTEDNTIGVPATRFAPTDTVYAEVETKGTAASYTLYAKWTGADGTVLADYGMKVNEPGMQRTVISLSKPDGWPSGTNRIELAINSGAPQTTTFEVK